MADLAILVAAFAARLRSAGVPVTTEQTARFAAAVELARPAVTGELYWLGRVTLLDRLGQIEVYDAAFGHVFGGLADVADFRGEASPPATAPVPPDVRPGTDRAPTPPEGELAPHPSATAAVDAGGGDSEQQADAVLAAASSEERLRHRDFATCTPDELVRLQQLVARLATAAPTRTARRTVGHSRGRRLDVRRTLRAAHRTGGDPVHRSFRAHTRRPRRLVLVADVSGSMEAYSRVYLHLLHGAVRGARAEAFVFATRLTRLTRPLRDTHPDVALARAVASAPDWSGGTRIGAAVKAFVDGWGRRGLARGAVVVVVSDGWERAEAAALGEQMARLSRLAHRIVWVNPRKAADRFAPLAAGMAAALPYVDTFVSGHSVHALDEVLAAIADAA